MNDVVSFLKFMFNGLMMWFVALATNYHDAILTLFVGFLFNIFIGIGVDVNINKKRFQMRKALDALKLLLFYYMLIIVVHIAMGRQYFDVGNTIITWLTYIVAYFYITNIFKNAKQLFPDAKAVDFIYSFLSTELLYRLKDYLGYKRFDHVKEDKTNENEINDTKTNDDETN